MNIKNDMNNGRDDIEIIHSWMRTRLSLVHRSGNASLLQEEPNTAEIQREFVQSKIKKIKEIFNEPLCKLVTIRSEFRASQDYLRSIHSFPEELRDHLDNPEYQKPFNYKYDAIEAEAPFHGAISKKPGDRTSAPSQYAALYSLSEFKDSDHSPKNDPEKYFHPRINKFWQELKDSNIQAVSDVYENPSEQKNIYCFFAGANKTDHFDIAAKHIIAIYFKTSESLRSGEDLVEKISQAIKVSKSLFEGLELISNINSELFTLEGMKIVGELIPYFANNEVAFADKISRSIEELRKLLESHAIGRLQKGESADIFFLNAYFEKRDNLFLPKLSVYPGVYRRDYRVSAFQVSHSRLPSATKFLFYNYLTHYDDNIVFGKQEDEDQEFTPIKLDSDFTSLFKSASLNTEPVEDWIESVWRKKEADFLHMVAHDTSWKDTAAGKLSPWEALNRSSNPLNPNLSLVAFVVEGEGLPNDRKSLPRGAYVIESKVADAFSDTDLRGLRAVLSGLASLIRSTGHRNSPLDYRPHISDAINNQYSMDVVGIDKLLLKRFRFLVQSLDVDELNLLIGNITSTIANTPDDNEQILQSMFKLNIAELAKVKDIAKLFERRKDNDVDDLKKALSLIEIRIQVVNNWLTKHDNVEGLTAHVIEFLEACPENFLWSNYLSSISQSLGDRVNSDVPVFRIIQPGYSASDMFMASIDRQLRQIVKLSTAEKLKKEIENYQAYVRYRVVNAARIPANSFSFDTLGFEGKALGSGQELEKLDSPFGALVSDLVSGVASEPKTVVTLLATVAYQVNTGNNGEYTQEGLMPDAGTTGDALHRLFRNDLQLWIVDGKRYRHGLDDIIALVRDVYRLPSTFVLSTIEEAGIEKILKFSKSDTERDRIKDMYEMLGKFRRLTGETENAMSRLQEIWRGVEIKNEILESDDFLSLYSYVHADMNSRNLTWAAGLKSFFMIDFEHVGVGLRGIDQSRLMVNLVTELYGATRDLYRTLQSEDELRNNISKSIDNGVQMISTLGCSLLRADPTFLPKLVDTIVEDLDESTTYLVNLEKIAKSIVGNQESTLSDASWNQFWGYLIFCASIKEFEYSCLSTNHINIDEFLKWSAGSNKPVLKMTVSGLEECVLAYFNQNDEAEQFQRRENTLALMRHLIAAKVLYGIINF